MRISLADVTRLFELFGWKYQQRDDHTLLAGFRGKHADFPLIARFNDQWLSLTVAHFLPPVPAAAETNVLRRLLELNGRTTLVRLALDEQGEVMLTADVPGHKRLDPDLFAMTVDLLTLNADDLYDELHTLLSGEEPAAGKTTAP